MPKAYPTAAQSAHTDANQQFSIIGVQGTLGTADIAGTAATVPIGVDPVTGAAYVFNLGPAGSTTVAPNLPVIAGTPADPGTPISVRLTDGAAFYTASSGGSFTNVASGTQQTLGTVGTVLGIGGTVQVSGASAGTNVNIVTGTQQTLGTVGVLNTGTINALASGTITGGTLQNLVTGTINALASGTITAGTLTNLVSGTINALAAGTITTGTVSVTTGTIVGKEVSGAAKVAVGMLVAGTDSGGTIYYPLINSSGAVSVTGASAGTFVNIVTGSQQTLGTVGTIPGIGIVTRIGNIGTIESGTVTTTLALNTGTITTIAAGTQNTLGTVGVLNAGTLNALASGTITAGTLTALNIGTVYKGIGAAAAGSFTAAGTINVAGSQLDTAYYDIGGTYVGTVFFEGQVGTSSFFAINAITPLGVIGSQTVGNGDFQVSMTGLDASRARLTYASGTLTYNARAANFMSPIVSVVGGSISNSGSTTGVGVVSALTTGSVAMTVGTLTTGTLQNLVTGTINALAAGTVTAGTLTNLVSGTINALAAGTITTGTVSVTTGTIVGPAASGVAASGNPLNAGGTDSGGTIRSILVDSTGVQRSSGSVVITVGTLTTGTLQNLVTGTINALASGTISGGTLQNLVSGTINALASGTITGGTLQNLVSGTINALAAGTITTGTVSVTAGTLSPIPTIGQLPFGTIGTTGVSVFGTLAGGTSSGAGTEIFVTGVSLSLPANGGSQDVSIGFGTNGGTFHAGTGRLVRGFFVVGGGIQKSFDPPINSGTNAQLTYFQAGAGTVHVDVTYFITPSTL